MVGGDEVTTDDFTKNVVKNEIDKEKYYSVRIWSNKNTLLEMKSWKRQIIPKQLTEESSGGTTQEGELVLVHGDGEVSPR